MKAAARSEPDQELARGELFADRYQVEELLGRGGMGAVYRAHDLALAEPIALKVFPLDPDRAPLGVMRFRQEVKLARRVTHPNVARVYDIGEHQGKLYLTMEFIDGATLRAVLSSERRLAPARGVEIARAVALGLSAAHAAGVIHRDLKPGNILLARGGRVVLSDFGIARSLVEESYLTTGVVGTPYYMSPEQAYGGPVDARADLYALGLVLYESLSGERAQGASEDLAATLASGGVPAPLVALVLRCLEKNPDQRPQSAGQLAGLLAEIGGALTSSEAPKALLGGVIGADAGASSLASRELSFGRAMDPRALAVLPFLYRGSKESDYLGDTIADELVDALSRTRGARVIGTGVTAKYRQARDPQIIGRELGASAVIDGSVQLMDGRVRISVRLLDGESRVQLWSDHYEGALGDLFTFQGAIARRVAEELRVELTTRVLGEGAPAEAIEQYLAARRAIRGRSLQSIIEAVECFARSIELSPGFAPALAGHAMACLRSWFLDDGAGAPSSNDWDQAASVSVARTLALSPDLAESHLAAGLFAAHHGDYAAAARSLTHALAIAPTCAEANEFLGMLESEAGYGEASLRRLKLADELDPRLFYALLFQARYHALRGRNEECDAIMVEYERRWGAILGQARSIYARIAAWRGDHRGLARWARTERPGSSPAEQLVVLYARTMVGEIECRVLEQRLSLVFARSRNVRQLALLYQVMTEVYVHQGEMDAALHSLRCASASTIDLDWLELCPLLGPLRALPDFAEARRMVRVRVEALRSG
jgi:eukaryotic-like serine/threonine-protein kinase